MALRNVGGPVHRMDPNKRVDPKIISGPLKNSGKVIPAGNAGRPVPPNPSPFPEIPSGHRGGRVPDQDTLPPHQPILFDHAGERLRLPQGARPADNTPRREARPPALGPATQRYDEARFEHQDATIRAFSPNSDPHERTQARVDMREARNEVLKQKFSPTAALQRHREGKVREQVGKEVEKARLASATRTGGTGVPKPDPFLNRTGDTRPEPAPPRMPVQANLMNENLPGPNGRPTVELPDGFRASTVTPHPSEPMVSGKLADHPGNRKAELGPATQRLAEARWNRQEAFNRLGATQDPHERKQARADYGEAKMEVLRERLSPRAFIERTKEGSVRDHIGKNALEARKQAAREHAAEMKPNAYAEGPAPMAQVPTRPESETNPFVRRPPSDTGATAGGTTHSDISTISSFRSGHSGASSNDGGDSPHPI